MNLYFVLEGEKTETLLYPKWINFFIPELTQVYLEKQVSNNNFFIFSGGGIPSIYNTTVNAIKDINSNPIFDRLIVCLDSEGVSIQTRVDEITEYINESGVKLNETCKIDFIIQNICIESWFLGNRKIVKKIPENPKLREFINFYNVIEQDPELMDKADGFRNKAHFHFAYFKEILREHKLSYSKSNPKVVLEKSFLEELIKRTSETTHLPSLKNLFNLLLELKVELK